MTLIPANPIFSGGMGLMAVGGIAASLRAIPNKIMSHAKRGMFFECIIDSFDTHEFHFWTKRWLSTRPETRKTSNFQLVTPWNDATDSRDHMLTPGPGDHVITYEGAKFWVSVQAASGKADAAGSGPKIVFRCRKRDREAFVKLLHSVQELGVHPNTDLTEIYVPSGSGMSNGWSLHTTRRQRALESIVLPEDTLEPLLTAVRTFAADRDRYDRLGIPYRFGILLSGPPGNGKSTLAMVLASLLQRNLYALALSSYKMDDQFLADLLGSVPKQRALVAIEDIDGVVNGREITAENKLTFSGLLNAIDGPMATEGRILILTTNRPEQLDPALIRPGRIDIHVRLDNASRDQARRLFLRFFDGETSHAEIFASWAGDGTHSMASLQGHLLEHMLLGSAQAAQKPCS